MMVERQALAWLFMMLGVALRLGGVLENGGLGGVTPLPPVAHA
jgi:hypothetical protein